MMLRSLVQRSSKRPCNLLVRHTKQPTPSRCLSQAANIKTFNPDDVVKTKLEDIRNIGVSAHIDSGKTTVSERILFYGGRIDAIHDVKGKDGVGAKMDSMELEKQRGITIKSAATSLLWKGKQLNLIDTPGHIDFTVEVERALRVLDGAILVLCASSGVQTQTYTVYRQMKRYNVPFISFINKMDRYAANADRTIQQMREDMGLNAAFLYFPIGAERSFEGLVDVLGERSVYYEGDYGENVVYRDLPTSLEGQLIAKRLDLIESLSNVDEEIGELYLMEENITSADIEAAIKRAVMTRSFTPVIAGSALKNKGVQTLLDCVNTYLPNPGQIENYAINAETQEKVLMCSERSAANPAVGLAFKLEESTYGQLTYVRMYQGCFSRGSNMINTRTGEKQRVPRLVLMHSNETENITTAYSGDIVAMIGANCASGDTFVDAKTPKKDIVSMESMYIPDPVISMAIKNKHHKDDDKFSKALARFVKEDPTFRSAFNPENKEIVISGMGELQLDIYAERIRREYECEVELGEPTVNYRETLTEPVEFSVTYKRQSGGRGQFGEGYGEIEPLEDASAEVEFVNAVTQGMITSNYIKSVEKGVREAVNEGALTGHKISGIRFTLRGGRIHSVDSSDWAFSRVGYYAIKEHFVNKATVLEPWMDIEVSAPKDYSGEVIQSINERGGKMRDLDIQDKLCHVRASAPLQVMFGYSSYLRKHTSGMGTFTMEFQKNKPVEPQLQEQLIADYRETKAYKNQQASGVGV